MDACVRCLRDGRAGAAADSAAGGARAAAAANVLLLVDNTAEGCPGGDAMFDQLLLNISRAIREGRSQAAQLHAVAIDRSPSELTALGAHAVTDLFTDPCGWLPQQQQQQQKGPSSSSSTPDSSIAWCDLAALQAICQQQAGGSLLPSAPASVCLVLAGLSTLLHRHDSMQVLQVLHRLRSLPQVSSMLLFVHEDLHPPQLMAALQGLSTAVLQLQPVPGLQQELIGQATGRHCHGQLSATIRRSRPGRLKAEQQLFTMLPGGGVDVYAAPQGVVLDAKALIQTTLGSSSSSSSSSTPGRQQQQQAAAAAGAPPASAAAGAAGAAAAAGAALEPPPAEVVLAKKLSSSMRLDTSEQERAAKANVQLPYEHQGAGRAYATGDARSYLPPAAGGFGPGVPGTSEGAAAAAAGRLGHILYVRDSDEEHDSDEDPDDDLDV